MADQAFTDARPFSYFETYNVVVTSAGMNQQLMRAPWPLDMYVELIAVKTANSLASAGQLVMWDQDLSNTTPTTRGSAGQALAVFEAGAAPFSGQAANVDEGAHFIPATRFYGGIACQASVINMGVSFTVRIAR